MEVESEEESPRLVQSALPVSGPPLPPSDVPPATADEYLRMVQYEALHCAQVVEHDVEQEDMGDYASSDMVARCRQLDSQVAPGQFPVSESWRQDVLACYKESRKLCKSGSRYMSWDLDGDMSTQLAAADARSVNELVDRLSKNFHSTWLFGALCYLDTPLLCDTMCALQELRRILCERLANETDQARATELHALNIVIRDFFGQR